MNFLTPLTEFEKRTGRRRNDVVADGEHVRFDIMLMDGRSKPATEQIADQRIKAQVDREHAAHDHKFSFMGDAAPKFDRERAEFLARERLSASSTRQLRDAALAARAGDSVALARVTALSDQAEQDFNDGQASRQAARKNAWRDPSNTRDPADVMRDMARLARYSGC